jgi:hypothetical protein
MMDDVLVSSGESSGYGWNSRRRVTKVSALDAIVQSSGIGAFALEARKKCRINLAARADLDSTELQTNGVGGFLCVPQCRLDPAAIGRIEEQDNMHSLRQQLMEQCQPLRRQVHHAKIGASRVATRAGEARVQPSLTGSSARRGRRSES